MSSDHCPAWEYRACTCKVECPDDRTERTAAEERADRVTRLRRRADYWEFKAALRTVHRTSEYAHKKAKEHSRTAAALRAAADRIERGNEAR